MQTPHSDGANRNDQLRTPSRASSASRRCVGVMVSTTERNAGAAAAVWAVGCAGELVVLRVGTCGSCPALAGLDAGVEDGPATGDEELDACTCVSLAGTLSIKDAFA